MNTLQADAGELLLTRQGGRSLLLTCHTGEASRAFEERLEFQAGEGFPGPTLATGSLSESSNLLTEKRSLRNSVKHAGFRRHIGAPIIGPSGRHGVIGVASRDPNPHVPLLLTIITAVYALLGLRLEAVMAPLQAAVRNYLTHAGNVKEQTGAMHRMLEQIARFTDASNAEPYIATKGTSPTRIAPRRFQGRSVPFWQVVGSLFVQLTRVDNHLSEKALVNRGTHRLTQPVRTLRCGAALLFSTRG